ncbi:MAG: hypothetical protein EAZ40_14050 [Rhodobacterales bacterium]|nr:MAG: hypothetical protein EAZ40_14050 [Rhodobacterales bacterium]
MARLMLIPLALVLCALSACKPHETWRQKLTLVVETPTGEVSGSAVVEVDGNMRQLPGSANEINYTIRGEATVVEVLPGRYLFALLGGSEGRFYAATKDRFPGMKRQEWLQRIPHQTEPVSLLPDQVPMLVTFDDISKPETVRRVDLEDLAAVFGDGVRLKAVTLEITEEAVTEGRVEGVLGANFLRDSAKMRKDALAKAKGLNDPYFWSLQGTLARSNFILDEQP